VAFAGDNGVPEPCVSAVRLAVSEAVTNAVVHAFCGLEDSGTVIVTVYVRDRAWIEVFVTDHGSGMAPRDDSPGIGLGLSLICRLADQFDHYRPPEGVGTELRMRFSFAASDGK
jgi:anti-sigma regulatory factor (Ser/Thr protein kinase)